MKTQRYVAVVGITDDREHRHYEAGADVPASLVRRAGWLVDQGYVVEAEPVVEEGE